MTDVDFLKVLLQKYDPVTFFAFIRAHELYNVSAYTPMLEEPILDLGCGDGLIASLLFGRQLEWGVDVSQEAVDQAVKSGSYGRAWCADAHHLDLTDASVGGVYSNCVLEHIDDLPGLFSEIARVLKPGSVFLFTCMAPSYYELNPVFRALNRPGLRGLRRRMIEAENALHHHVSIFDRPTYEKMLSVAGFSVELHQFFSPPDVTNFYALRDTLSKYAFPPTFNLTHSGMYIRQLVRARGRNPGPEFLNEQYDRLKPLCYQRPPEVNHTDGAMQIFAARRL